MADSHPLLELSGIHKAFGGVRALRGAHLTVSAPGVIHGLIGANGSGKSTLLGILSGQHRADAGEIRLGGEAVSFSSPFDALRYGVAMVSQETAVAPHLSIAENIYLGHSKARSWRGIDWRRTNWRARQALADLGLSPDPEALVSTLRPDQRQMVEIARALAFGARVVILDEPTSSLSEDEVESLFGALRQLREAGAAILFVSHRLDELFQLSDAVTILRDGQTVTEGNMAAYTHDSLIEAMVGDVPSATERASRASGSGAGGSALRVDHISAPGVLNSVSLDVQPGEVLGLSGLVGSGRSELLEVLFGLRPAAAGTISVGEQAPMMPRDPRRALDSGLAFVPADRKNQGLVLGMNIAANLNMARTCRRHRLRDPHGDDADPAIAEIARRMQVRAPSLEETVENLSGGNQQKVVLGKALLSRPKILLLDEPTRGVDVGAKQEIYELLRLQATEGMTLLVSSSENSELLSLCDRIAVMTRGRLAATVSREDATEANLAHYAEGQI